ncbi:MAG: hypothetical protein M3Z31_19080 [Pseudomonadota bacterium]|nr:hypothetical protein [Pseudomonadota bacterium]
MLRRTVLRLTGAFLVSGSAMLAGCNTFPFVEGGPTVEAPTLHVGDRWVYRAQDGFMRPVVWEETREVIGATNGGYVVRVTQRGPAVDKVRTEQLSTSGRVQVGAVFDEETRRFEQELKRYEFPLAPGKTWNQWVKNFNEDTKRTGELNRYVRIGGWQRVATPAGSFDAIAVNVIMHLDDDEFWRERTDCTYRLWYAPAVNAVVREEKEAQYYEKSGKIDSGPIRSQHAVLELISYTPG